MDQEKTDKKNHELEKRIGSLSPKILAALFNDLVAKDAKFGDRLEALLLSHDKKALYSFLLSRMEAFYSLAELPSFRDLFSLARDLRTFLSDIEIFLFPSDSELALDLLDRFFTLDYLLAEFEEDATPLQEVFSEASLLWLRIAKTLDRKADVLERILDHFLNDRASAKADMLRRADLALSPDDLTHLSERLLQEVDHQENEAEDAWLRYRVALGLRYLSSLLRRPALLEKSILLLDDTPGPRQIREIVQAYLDDEGPESALMRLAGDWGDLEIERLKLLDLVYGAMDDREMLFEIRREAYAAQPSAESLQALLEVCAPDEREAYLAAVPDMALHAGNLYSALNLLFAANFPLEAEALLAGRKEELARYDHMALGRILAKFEKADSLRGQIFCIRALVSGILSEGKVRAFDKALDYCETLARLDEKGLFSEPLFSHQAFLKALHEGYAGLSSFWQKLDARFGTAFSSKAFPEKQADPPIPGESSASVPRETSREVKKKRVPRGTSGGVFG